MRIKRITGPLLAGLIAGLTMFAVACGGDSDADPTAVPGTGATGATGAAPTATPTEEPEAGLSGDIIVFAAASLTDAFSEIGEAFTTANPDAVVEFNFAGSSALRTQLEEGAPADVFASADVVQMSNAQESGVASEDDTIFVRNSLVVITPADNPGEIETLADLATPGINLVLAAPEVPVGNYARQVLESAEGDPEYGAGFSDSVLANLVSNEANVRQVVVKVELGEADAGIVYGSDVTPSVAASLAVIEIPEALNVVAEYPIALTAETENSEVAQAFIDFVLSSEGQSILASWGFQTGE